jgi:hypothetical protein
MSLPRISTSRGSTISRHPEVNNSFALQINDNVDKVLEQLDELSPKAFQTLIEVIAAWIGKNKSPSS